MTCGCWHRRDPSRRRSSLRFPGAPFDPIRRRTSRRPGPDKGGSAPVQTQTTATQTAEEPGEGIELTISRRLRRK
jgi:hypothetical protein